MKLISMVEFVLEQAKLKNDAYELAHLLIDYANFLKQPLTLGMFVPAKFIDGEWVVLEEPDPIKNSTSEGNFLEYDEDYLKEYQEAKDKVLFKGAKIDRYGRLFLYGYLGSFLKGKLKLQFPYETIRNISGRGIELTESAKKKIGL